MFDNEFEAIHVLEDHQYFEVVNGWWQGPSATYSGMPSIAYDALRYLIDEWDHGGLIEFRS